MLDAPNLHLSQDRKRCLPTAGISQNHLKQLRADLLGIARDEHKRALSRVFELFACIAGQSVAEYLNHYNSRLNKCIYLEIANTYNRGLTSFMWMKLFDLNENREIAVYSKGEGVASAFCLVQAKWCQTEAEWRTLIKPFMED